MTLRESFRVHGYEVSHEPGQGWRCTCPLWEANGCGCVHTAQVAAAVTLSAQAAALRARRVLKPARDGLQALEGCATRVVAARGLLDFEVAGRLVSVVASRLRGARIQEGDCLRLIVRARTHDGFHDVLAIQAADAPHPRYVGTAYPSRTSAFAAGVAAVAEFSGDLLMILLTSSIAVPLLICCLLGIRQRRRVLRRFGAEPWSETSATWPEPILAARSHGAQAKSAT